jgi:HD-like signal output (HDOD) protein
MAELQSTNTSFHKVGEIIVKDVGMTAKILQMVNSAFFGLRRQIASPQEAVSYLGLENFRLLARRFMESQHADRDICQDYFANGKSNTRSN